MAYGAAAAAATKVALAEQLPRCSCFFCFLSFLREKKKGGGNMRSYTTR